MKKICFVVFCVSFLLMGSVLQAEPWDNTKWRSADPCEKWRDWQKGPARVITPELRGGKASHSLSPAELVFYSAKENNINPVLLLAIMEDQQRLDSLPRQVENDFEGRLFFALNYAVCPVVNWAGFYGGFYPQLVASSYILWANWLYGVPLEEVYASSSFAGDPENLKRIYAEIVTEISAITGDWHYQPYPVESGYYLDFRGKKMKPAIIQKFLERTKSSLRDRKLFQRPARGETPACPED